MDIGNLFKLLGGLGFFLYGMSLMGGGLKSAAGSKLESILEKLSSTPIKGVILGTIVTAIIQSSSATTVMVVGFVNSGIMKLSQAIGIVMGANIGTTVTGWILCLAEVGGETWYLNLLSPSNFAPLLVMIGTIFAVFIKDTKKKNVGMIVLGFGTLMIGMDFMSTAAEPIAELDSFKELLTLFSNPLLGVLVGCIITAVIQSSSASVGILQALSLSCDLPYATVIPIVLGMGIGACVPVLISAIGANTNGKRTSLIYLYFNLFRTIIFLPILIMLDSLTSIGLFDINADMIGIATVNTLINLCATIILFPFVGFLEKLAAMTVPEKHPDNESKSMLELIDKRFLATPGYALSQCHTVISHMAEMALFNIKTAMELQTAYEKELGAIIEQNENTADEYEDALGSYLVEVSRLHLTDEESYMASMMIHTIGDLERILDHSMNLCEIAEKMSREKIRFSDAAKQELETINSAIIEILSLTVTAVKGSDIDAALKIEPLEEIVDRICTELKDRHVDRLQHGLCNVSTGFIFNDLLNNYERISDHCSNLAIHVLRSGDGVYDPHRYLHGLEHKDYFERLLGEYEDKYCHAIGMCE